MIFKNPKNKVQIRCIFYKNTMVGDSKIYALCILCILDQFFYIWANFDPKMQFTAPILLITLSNHLLRKGALFFRKRGLFLGYPKTKKGTLEDPGSL